jgi:hypothetical protein
VVEQCLHTAHYSSTTGILYKILAIIVSFTLNLCIERDIRAPTVCELHVLRRIFSEFKSKIQKACALSPHYELIDFRCGNRGRATEGAGCEECGCSSDYTSGRVDKSGDCCDGNGYAADCEIEEAIVCYLSNEMMYV